MYFDSNQFNEIVTNQFDLQSSSCTDHNQISLSQISLHIADKFDIQHFFVSSFFKISSIFFNQ